MPLPSGDILEVNGVRSKAHQKHLMSMKSDEKKLDISVVRDFPTLSWKFNGVTPPPLQVEVRINLVPDATPVAKAPYRLAPSKMQEFANQLQELL